MKSVIMLTIFVLGLIVCAVGVSNAAPMGTAWTYQGRLIDANSVADGEYDFSFKLYDAEVVGNKVANDVNVGDLDVIDGYFTTELDFGNVFNGDARWLEIGIRSGDSNDMFITLSPRQEVTPTPYALYAESAGGDNDWMISGNHLYSIPSQNVGIGTTNPSDKLDVAGSIRWGNSAAAQGRLGYGTHVSIGSWTNYDLKLKTNNIDRMTLDTSGNVGIGTTTPDYKLHIEGKAISGVNSSAFGGYATISGGQNNTAGGEYATVGGGQNNDANGSRSTIGGGYNNIASGSKATVCGGYTNQASGNNSTVGGGFTNVASGGGATISGGSGNQAGEGATVGGGLLNIASGSWSSVCGGWPNTARGDFSFVGGGASNNASGNYSTVAGGSNNEASGVYWSTVSGGYLNAASGDYSTVPGGVFNTANGSYSFATGRRAKAIHQGAFVWADSTDANFASTGNNQFLIRASGGVGIGTSAPQQALHVHGNALVDSQVFLPNLDLSVVSGQPVYWDSFNGELFIYVSSSRYKENIQLLREEFSRILQAKPKSYTCKTTGRRGIGFIAEEFDELGLCDLVIYDQKGRPDGIAYQLISLYLLEVLKDEVETTREQEEAINQLEEKNRSLEERVEGLEKMLQRQQLALAKLVQQ